MIIPLVVAVLYYWMIFFLWMNMICCTLKHLQCSSERLFKWKRNKKQTLTLLFASCLRPPDTSTTDTTATLVSRISPERGSITWTWYSCRLTLPFVMTSVPQQCTDYARYQYAPWWFISASITLISDCLLSRQDLVSNILTDVVDESLCDS